MVDGSRPLFYLTTVSDENDFSDSEEKTLSALRREQVRRMRDLLAQHPEYFEGQRFSSVNLNVTWGSFSKVATGRSRVTRGGELLISVDVNLNSLRPLMRADLYGEAIFWLALTALQRTGVDATKTQWLSEEAAQRGHVAALFEDGPS